MILRRVIAHFRKQEWTAIAIDFLIVVLGVFIGIQVANWNGAREDRQAAANYLTDIASDVRADMTEVSRVAHSARTRIAAASHILKQSGIKALPAEFTLSQMTANDVFAGKEIVKIPDLAPPDAGQRHRLWPLATAIYGFDTNRSAYDALVSSGKIELIKKPELKRALQAYYYLVRSLEETQRRTIMPLRVTIVEKGLEHGLSPDGEMAEQSLVERAAGDPSLAAVIAMSREHAVLYLMFCNLLDEQARRLLVLIEESESRS